VFGIGPQEVLVIAFLVLLVVGPRKFVDVSKDMGRFVNEARTYTSDLRNEVVPEEVSEARREAGKLKSEVSEKVRGARREVEEFRSELVSSGENRGSPTDGPRTGEKRPVGQQRGQSHEDADRSKEGPNEGPNETELVSSSEKRGEPADEPHPEERDQARDQRQEAGEVADHPSQTRTQSEQRRVDFDGFGSGESIVDTRSRHGGLRRIFSRKR
jgi:sec-independent protein translocase protein TatB